MRLFLQLFMGARSALAAVALSAMKRPACADSERERSRTPGVDASEVATASSASPCDPAQLVVAKGLMVEVRDVGRLPRRIKKPVGDHRSAKQMLAHKLHNARNGSNNARTTGRTLYTSTSRDANNTIRYVPNAMNAGKAQ